MAAEVRVAGESDRTTVAAMLARAFAEDPAICFIFPDPVVQARRVRALFTLLFDEDRDGLPLTTTGGEAAALWRPPGRHRTTRLAMLREALPMLRVFGLGATLRRALAVSNAIDAHFPPGDFWYLHIAGCEPIMQGKGFGGAVIRVGLEKAESSGVPAYLETATKRNLGLYQALGFEVIDEWTVPKGGPHFWSMLRKA